MNTKPSKTKDAIQAQAEKRYNRIPPLEEIRARLMKISQKQVREIAATAGVTASTLMKIRYGVTDNPGIETCRKFLPYLPPPNTVRKAAYEKLVKSLDVNSRKSIAVPSGCGEVKTKYGTGPFRSV